MANVGKITAKTNWPFFGTLVVKDKNYKLSTNTMYVDLPNRLLINFFYELCNFEESDNLLKQKELASEYNKLLGSMGNVVRLDVKRIAFSDKKYGVFLKVDWNNLLSTLDNFACSDASIEEKYDYLAWCRCLLGSMKTPPSHECMKNKVTELITTEITEMNNSIDRIIEDLSNSKTKMRTKFMPSHDLSMFSVYIPEIIASFKTIKSCINEGTVSTCYREMRIVLENTAWSMFDDFLLFKKGEKTLSYNPPYRGMSKDWFNWARTQKAQLNDIDQLKANLSSVVDSIYLLGKITNYAWTKNAIRKEIISNMSYPLLLFSSGWVIPDSGKPIMQIPDKVPQFDVKDLIPFIKEHLENRVIDLKGGPLADIEKRFVCELVNSATERMPEKIVPPYPSNRFVLEMVGYITQQNLHKQYGDYSFFIHSYNDTWQHVPYSSVLEFKILNRELSIFMSLLSRVFNNYLEALPQTSRLKFPEKAY